MVRMHRHNHLPFGVRDHNIITDTESPPISLNQGLALRDMASSETVIHIRDTSSDGVNKEKPITLSGQTLGIVLGVV